MVPDAARVHRERIDIDFGCDVVRKLAALVVSVCPLYARAGPDSNDTHSP